MRVWTRKIPTIKCSHDFRLFKTKLSKACEFTQMCLIHFQKRFDARWYIEKCIPCFSWTRPHSFMAFIKSLWRVRRLDACVSWVCFVSRWEKFEVSNHNDNMCVCVCRCFFVAVCVHLLCGVVGFRVKLCVTFKIFMHKVILLVHLVISGIAGERCAPNAISEDG